MVWRVLPGFRGLALFERERRAGAGDRRSVCWRKRESCLVSQGSSRKPGNPTGLWDAGQGLRMTHPFSEGNQVSAEAQSRRRVRRREENGGPSERYCGRSLTSSSESVNRGCKQGPQTRGWGWRDVNKGRWGIRKLVRVETRKTWKG